MSPQSTTPRTRLVLATLLAAGLAVGPAVAQTPPAQGTPSTPPADAAPAPATPPVGDAGGMLQVATVKVTNGWRATKLIGSSVQNEQGQAVGTIDDLILTREDKVMVAVVSVGGFLGIGSKLVAVPWDRFRFGQDDRLTLPGATKEALTSLPAFTHGG